MERKLLSLLGIARKAGKLCWGQETAAEAIRGGKAGLLILASDISGNSAKKAQRTAESFQVPILTLSAGMAELERAIGKRSGILAVTDEGFAKRLSELYAESRAAESEISKRKSEEEHAI